MVSVFTSQVPSAMRGLLTVLYVPQVRTVGTVAQERKRRTLTHFTLAGKMAWPPKQITSVQTRVGSLEAMVEGEN